MASRHEVLDFIGSTFRSVWDLELLCFLRQRANESLSHADMVAGLRGSDAVVTRSLGALAAAGLVLVEEDGSARYGAATDRLGVLAQAAEELYSVSPDAVRRRIVASANPGISAFADAFRIRKD